MREYLHGPLCCLSLFLRERLLSMPFAWSLLVAFTCKGTHFFGTRLVCSSVLSSNGAEIIVWACRQVSFFLRVPSRSGCLVSGLEAIHGQLFSCASYYQLTSFSCLGNVKTSKQRCQNKNVKRYNVKTLIERAWQTDDSTVSMMYKFFLMEDFTAFCFWVSNCERSIFPLICNLMFLFSITFSSYSTEVSFC